MDDYAKIQGARVAETFRYLEAHNILIKIAVQAAGFENVTVITELDLKGRNPCFWIDPPDGLSDALYLTKRAALYFEFNGEDQLLYKFELTFEDWQGDLCFPLPMAIERIQRRRNFRLPAPMGTSLTLHQMVPPVRLLVLDFSLGGLLCMVETVRLENDKRRKLLKGRTFNNLDLTFEEEDGETIIRILRARIVRTGRNPKTDHDQYAFEFILIDRAEEKKLTDLLYGIQRKLLRRRVVLEA